MLRTLLLTLLISAHSSPITAHSPNILQPVNNEVYQQSSEAPTLPEKGQIFLVRANGEELNIGSVEFRPADKGKYIADVDVDDDAFVDQFLSMRPFDCLTDAQEWFCHLSYPYELNNSVTHDDLTELSYQLLFIWKSPKDFGIDPWNGLYYDLSLNPDGSIAGQLLEGDLSVLASPPEPFSHPIDLGEFINDGAKSRLFPSLIIRR